MEIRRIVTGHDDKGRAVFKSDGIVAGVPVDGTIPNTPAGNSALVEGDVITSIDGQSVTTTTDVAKVLQAFRPGDSVSIGYVNVDGASSTLSLTLISGPAQ